MCVRHDLPICRDCERSVSFAAGDRLWSLAVAAGALLLSASVVGLQPLSAQTDRVAWVLFIDDLHLDFRNTGRIRQLAQTFLKDIVLEGDLVAIRTSGPSGVLTDFSSARELLPWSIKLTGGGLTPGDVANLGKESGMNADELRKRAGVSLSSATAAAALLSRVEPRRRALLYISNGHAFDMATLIEARALAHVAGTNGVRIFTVDAASMDRLPRVPASDPAWEAHKALARESLRVIAEQSGGLAILDAQDARTALQRVSSTVRQ